MLESKDNIIDLFKEEIHRKNQLISELLEKQEHLEQRLVKMEQVLMFDDKDFEEQTALREDRLNLAETNATVISEEFQPSQHDDIGDPKLTDFSSEHFQSEEEKFQSKVEKVDEEWREIYKEA